MPDEIPRINIEQEVINLIRTCHIDRVLTLPCDKIKNLLPFIPMNFNEIPLTREEDGVGLAAGLYLAGQRPIMLIQSTGIGNSMNALSSLHMTYNLPLPILASWRGVYKEGTSAHVHFGKNLPKMLESNSIPYLIVESPSELNMIEYGINASFEKRIPYVVLISPKLWENSNVNPCKPCECPNEREYVFNEKTIVPKATHTRIEMIKGITTYIKDKIIISNIGITSKELFATMDQPTNFYMLGSLGLATSIGIGMASSKKNREIIVLDGEGSLLMNPNALASLAQIHPENLTVITFDNGVYASTGCQRSFSVNLDIQLLAKVYGIENTTKVSTPAELLKVLETKVIGPRFIHTIILPLNSNVPSITLSPVEIRDRFVKAIE